MSYTVSNVFRGCVILPLGYTVSIRETHKTLLQSIMKTIKVTQVGSKTVRIQKGEFSFRATISQNSDINESGDVLDVKCLQTLKGIEKWISNHFLLA